MKTFFNNRLIIFILLLFSFSCQDFLEEVPESRNTSANYFKSESDAWSAVNGIYYGLRNVGINASSSSGAVFNYSMTMTCDDMHYNSSVGDVKSIANFSYTSSNKMPKEAWQRFYTIINRANNVLDNIDRVPELEEDVKKQIIGEARFLRGFSFFYLVRLFGGVPLTLTQEQSMELLPRESVDNVYAAIIEDFEYAYENLSIEPSEIGRATKGAAAGLLSKVYLTRQDWASASQYAQKVVQLGVYSLLPNIKDYFDVDKKETNTEAIFEGQGAKIDGLEGSLFRYLNAKYIPENPVTSEGLRGSLETFISTWDLYFSYDKNDSRQDLLIAIDWNRTIPTSTRDSSKYPSAYKYVEMARPDALYSSNWPFLRYSDVLLILAEALNEQDKTAEAFHFINMVRRRAFGYSVDEACPNDLSGLSKEQFRDAVYKERRLELPFEGHRWFDLVRTKRLVTVMNNFAARLEREYEDRSLDVRRMSDPTRSLARRNYRHYTINPVSDKHYLYPIPEIEIAVDPLLEQNPGF